MESVIGQVNQVIKTTLGPEWDLSLLISKALGYGIIAGSLLLKVPQILKVASSKSAESLSASSIAMENIGFTISLLAGYKLLNPFSTYGESAFILVQNFFLLVLVLKYTQKLNVVFFTGLAIYAGAVFAALNYVDNDGFNLLLKLNIPLFIISKFPQIITIIKNKSVGQLSFITCFLNLAGSLARVFTTIKEVNNPVILLSYGIGSFLNSVILILFFVYGTKKVPARKQVGAKKTN
ncbi:hypothetical protein ACTFIY_000422 [Dictyostelium cf. discoideum]